MAAESYYHPQNANPAPAFGLPSQTPRPQPYQANGYQNNNNSLLTQSPQPYYGTNTNPQFFQVASANPYANSGALQPHPLHQSQLPPQAPQYAQVNPQSNLAQESQYYIEPLRPSRSYSEPPYPQNHAHHRHRRERSRSRSSSRSKSRSRSSSRETSRSRHRNTHTRHHRNRDISDDRSREYQQDRDLSGERSRERHISRKSRKREQKSKVNNNTFWGALGGGVIGDLIFPGLGTLGGAVLGGAGGHHAGKRSASVTHVRKHDTYEQEWEEGRRRRGNV